MSDKLESMLSSLGDAIDWPEPSPDLPIRVRGRIESEPTEVVRRGWLRPAIALAAVLAVTLVMVISPSARQAVADLLGAAGIRIGVTSDPAPATGAGLNLGEPVDLDDLQESVDFVVRVPVAEAPGRPDAVYLDDGEVTMVWASSPSLPAAENSDIGLLLSQRRAESEDIAKKRVGPESEVYTVEVEGGTALWIEGAAHTFTLLDDEGDPIGATTRLSANVLLWDARGVSHRLETTGGLESVLAIVETLTPLP